MTTLIDPLTETVTLTRIHLNRRSSLVRADLADRVGLHRTLMRLAPDQLGPGPRRRAGLLFRYEPHPRHSFLLIQTHQPPRLENLPAAYGHAQTVRLAPMFHALTPGRPVRYRITANPSRRQLTPRPADPDQPRPLGKIQALTGDAAHAWWARKADTAGLTLHTTHTQPHRYPRPHGGPYHHLLTFEGYATLTDPHALTAALLHGLGKGKPYGAGLLTLTPA